MTLRSIVLGAILGATLFGTDAMAVGEGVRAALEELQSIEEITHGKTLLVIDGIVVSHIQIRGGVQHGTSAPRREYHHQVIARQVT